MAKPARVCTIAPPRGSIVTKAFSAIRSVKGTRDLLPAETPLWQRVEEEARRVFDAYNFREIRTPVLERTDLFARSVGADTDIVTKEMYTFEDRDHESLTLRPEATASVVRASIEHGLFNEGGAHKLYYMGPMFRRERPQKGRYRQFYQIGAEVLGSDHPAIDAEVLEMQWPGTRGHQQFHAAAQFRGRLEMPARIHQGAAARAREREVHDVRGLPA